VTFEFQSKNHTATQSSFQNPCSKLSETSITGQTGFDSGFMPVDSNATNFPTITITVNDTAPIWGYCQQTNPVSHCGSGMVFSINAVEDSPNNFIAFQQLAEHEFGNASSTSTSSGSTASSTSSKKSGSIRAGINVGTLLAVMVSLWTCLVI